MNRDQFLFLAYHYKHVQIPYKFLYRMLKNAGDRPLIFKNHDLNRVSGLDVVCLRITKLKGQSNERTISAHAHTTGIDL